MHSSSLPTALVALLLTTLPAPVTFNLPGTHAQSQFRDHTGSLAPLPTSTNDPFRPVALLKPKREDPPICCLRPAASSLEPDDSEVFLSFEEWKAKRAAEAGGVRRDSAAQSSSSVVEQQQQQAGATPDASSSSNGSASSSGGGPVVGQDSVDGGSASFQATEQPHTDSLQTLSPHFRVPIIDRFNYASLDCSARVHSSHKSAKSAYNILSNKKDRYMLSPCPAPGEKQYVVVELCEDIVIDTVQLANFEFFSGVFREFTVSVAKTHVSEGPGQVGLEEWTVVGTYIGRNLRGVQSFHPPTSIRDFYRFIRIDFHSHYGNEYYCPISLLRVYGLTHLEQWKWDEWEAASRAKLEQNNIVPPPPVVTETIEEAPSSSSMSSSETQTSVSSSSSAHSHSSPVSSTDNTTVEVAPSGNSTEEIPGVEATPIGEESDTITFRHSTDIAPPLTSDETPSSDVPAPTPPSDSTPTNTQSDASHAEEESSPTPSGSSNSSSSVITSTIITESPTSAPPSSASATTTSTISLSATNLLSLPPLSSPLVHPPHPGGPPPSTGAESIYRTIMNRLTALEANTTLYARYVEEQTAGIRDVLRRMGEDVGRLEGMGRAREQVWRRERGEMERMERERRRVEGEVGELVRRVEVLVDEIVLEKRLGIAQLCLLLALLVFMTLTRGSRSDHIPANARLRVPGMREWGRRNLSFSGDWVSKLRNRSGSRNASVAPTLQGRSREPSGEKHKFPSTGSGSQELLRPPEPRPSGSSAPALPNITPHPSNPQLPPSAPQLINLPQSIRRDRDSRSSGSTSTVVPRPITPSHPLTLSLSARPRTPRRLNARHHSHNHDRHVYSRYPAPPTTPLRSSSMTFLPAQISASTSTPVGGVGVPTNADSGGSGGGVGGGGRVLVGPVPRSAKKWARSAHLHEVRRVVVQSPSLSLSPPMPEEDEAGGADGLSSGSGSGGDLTDTGRGGVVIRSVGSMNVGDVGVVEVLEMNGKGKQKGGRVGSVLGPPFEEGVRNGGEGNGEVDSGEETWVDTDADSEVEGEKQSGG